MHIRTYRTFTFVFKTTYLTYEKKKTTTPFLPKLWVSISLFFSQPFTQTPRKVLVCFICNPPGQRKIVVHSAA